MGGSSPFFSIPSFIPQRKLFFLVLGGWVRRITAPRGSAHFAGLNGPTAVSLNSLARVLNRPSLAIRSSEPAHWASRQGPRSVLHDVAGRGLSLIVACGEGPAMSNRRPQALFQQQAMLGRLHLAVDGHLLVHSGWRCFCENHQNTFFFLSTALLHTNNVTEIWALLFGSLGLGHNTVFLLGAIACV